MYRARTIGIVVPAYNEDEHIADVLAGIPGFVDVVYVVDDASTDRTADSVRDFATLHSQGDVLTVSQSGQPGTQNAERRTPRVELIRHAMNLGVGAAIATGYQRCLLDGMDIAVVMAGDNQMDPVQLPRLLDPIVDGRADYAKGDRTSCRQHLSGMSRWRRLGNWLLRRLTRIAVGNVRVNDPQNGYTAARRELLATLPLDDLYPRYGYCNQLLAWVAACRGRVLEVPMPARYLGERSKIRYGTYIPSVSRLLLGLMAERLVRRCRASIRPEATRRTAPQSRFS